MSLERGDMKPILECEYSLLQKNNRLHTLQLFPTLLRYTLYGSTDRSVDIPLTDIIGCKCLRLDPASDQRSFIQLFCYQMGKKDPSRVRKVYTFFCNKHTQYEDNFQITKRWKHVILLMLRRRPGYFINKTADEILQSPYTRRNYLVFVNPRSGPGNAMSIYEKQLRPMLLDAEADHLHIVTEYAGHAHDRIRDADLTLYTGILVVSGDGLLFEVINGLMEHTDWPTAIKTPVGIIAGGSGNAVATMVTYLAGEFAPKAVLANSIYNAVRFLAPRPFDLTVVQTPTTRYYSTIGVMYGLVADVDIDTEKYRNLGDFRFTIGAVLKILSPPFYKTRLSFLPVDRDAVMKQLADHDRRATRGQSTGDSAATTTTPSEHIDAFDTHFGTYNGEGGAQSIRPLDLVEEERRVAQREIPEPEGDESGPFTPLLVPLDEPVPVTWITIEDSFSTILACTSTHIAQESWGAPEARYDDGAIFLTCLRKPLSKKQLFDAFMALGDMSHPNYNEVAPCIEIYKVRAYRIEPQVAESYVTIDGENIGVVPVQGQALPGLSRIMAYAAEDKIPVS